jgi:hypothetical protein
MFLRQRIHAPAELLDASSSVRSMSYQRRVGDYFFPELLAFIFFLICGNVQQKTLQLDPVLVDCVWFGVIV